MRFTPENYDHWAEQREAGFDAMIDAVVWECLAKWLWLLGGRTELETWADAGDCCTEI